MDEKTKAAIAEYRAYLEKRIAECREQLDLERERAISSIEDDNYPECHRKNLIEMRVQVATYENALSALDSAIGNPKKGEDE